MAREAERKPDIKKRTRALALISGGLDSLLAARVVMDQGIDVAGVAFIMQFAAKDIDRFKSELGAAAHEAGVPTRTVDISEEFLKVIKNPGHGFGANMNPCIDCKILMLKTAKKIAEKEGFDFLVTGEVLGERPMSQRKDALNIIKRASGTEEMLLRPLSAKLLEETPFEKQGLVERGKLLEIRGRSRKKQFELAEKYGLTKYFSPAGGCLLTAEEFSNKLADLKAHGQLNQDQVDLLKHGRHFRLDDRTKVVIGRDSADNEELEKFCEGNTSLRMKDVPGPLGLLVGSETTQNKDSAGSILASYSKLREEKKVEILCRKNSESSEQRSVTPMLKEQVEKRRI